MKKETVNRICDAWKRVEDDDEDVSIEMQYELVASECDVDVDVVTRALVKGGILK